MSAAYPVSYNTVENNPQRDAEQSACLAESVHKKVDRFITRVATVGRHQFDDATEALTI